MKTIEEKAEEICERLTCHEVVADEREELENHWAKDPRWNGIVRPYSAEDVLKLRGNLTIAYTLMPCGGPIRFRCWRAEKKGLTGSPQSWPMQKLDSVGSSTLSN